MNINKFTQKSLQAVQNCERIAMDYGNQEIAQEHLLYALLTQDDSLIAKLMEKMGLDKNLIINRVEEAIQKRPKVQGGQQYVGQDLNNALIHAEESYVSLDASPFSEAMSEKAMELIGRSIRTYVADRSNLEAASDMLAGSLFAGIAFSWARLGNIHAMSHPVSAFFNVPHGVANGILFPYIVKYNEEAAFGKYQKIYNYISTEEKCESEFSKGMLEQAVRELNTQVGIPAKLSDAGVTDEYFAQMTEDAMKSGNIAINPQKTVREDILALYKEAL